MQKAPKPSKTTLLDHFYDHLEENDWLEGVDLYQSGRVMNLSTYEGLITGKVAGITRDSAEVRLKIHPTGHCIQWIECTCRKNRVQGQYCEHIAALMIHVDRERPALFQGLDTSTPLKPPVAPKKPRGSAAATAAALESERDAQAGATQSMLEHLKGNIQGVSLVAHGPALRVRIEIKPGHLTHYDLPLDAAAKFLKSHPKLASATTEVRELVVFDEAIEIGTRIYQPEPEKIVAERVIAIKLKREAAAPTVDARLPHVVGKYQRLVTGEEPVVAPYLFINVKTGAKHVGQEYFFLQGHGYYPLNRGPAGGSTWSELPITRSFKEDDAAEFVRAQFSEYMAAGAVFVDESLQGQVIMEAPELSEVEVLSEGEGWFRLDPRYGRGKASISMAELMRQWRKKRRKYVRSGDVWVKVPEFVTEHQWEIEETGDSIKVDAIGLLRLKAAFGDFDQFVGSKKLLNKIRNRLEFQPETAVAVAQGSKLQLRGYQDMGLRWMWWLHQNGLHGLLADEMGLGKTHQAMALMSALQLAKPDAKFMVVCPTTVLDHWLDKVEEFAPNLRPLKYHGAKRSSLLTQFDRDHNLMITSYGVVLRDIRHLGPKGWECMILDEAHFVKNNDTATYQAVCRVNSKMRLCLTGTPMENHLGELKNIFDFLVPGYLGSDEYFRKNFLSPINNENSAETTLALQKLIHPLKMRRTKDQVLPDLPAKVEDLRHCGLSDEQVKLYRDVVSMKAAPLVAALQDDGAPVPFMHVFATLTLLKQICNHPALVTEDGDWTKHESGKFELLKELLDEAIGSGHKVVIFSQYVKMIDIISQYLDKSGIGHVKLTGQSRNRGDIIKNFQTKPELKVFLGSLLAGGIGIDLTAASVVVHYDRWWNASKENQATDRVHRIGQNKNVQVMKLVTRGTLEEKIDRMIRSKQALFEKFLDQDEEIFKTLTRQELIELLQ